MKLMSLPWGGGGSPFYSFALAPSIHCQADNRRVCTCVGGGTPPPIRANTSSQILTLKAAGWANFTCNPLKPLLSFISTRQEREAPLPATPRGLQHPGSEPPRVWHEETHPQPQPPAGGRGPAHSWRMRVRAWGPLQSGWDHAVPLAPTGAAQRTFAWRRLPGLAGAAPAPLGCCCREARV